MDCNCVICVGKEACLCIWILASLPLKQAVLKFWPGYSSRGAQDTCLDPSFSLPCSLFFEESRAESDGIWESKEDVETIPQEDSKQLHHRTIDSVWGILTIPMCLCGSQVFILNPSKYHLYTILSWVMCSVATIQTDRHSDRQANKQTSMQ